jgi:hypothetical protein
VKARLTIGVLVASLFAVSWVAPSQAVANCSGANKVCLYDGVQQTGPDVQLGINGHRVTKVPLRMNNKASSVGNSTTFTTIFYNRRDGTGPHICLNPDQHIDDLSVVGTGWDNKISSYRVTRRTACPL